MNKKLNDAIKQVAKELPLLPYSLWCCLDCGNQGEFDEVFDVEHERKTCKNCQSESVEYIDTRQLISNAMDAAITADLSRRCREIDELKKRRDHAQVKLCRAQLELDRIQAQIAHEERTTAALDAIRWSKDEWPHSGPCGEDAPAAE